MHYLIISFTHKNAALEVREKLAFPDDSKVHTALQNIRDHEAVNEAILLSTCNRMEILCSCNAVHDASTHIFSVLGTHSGISSEKLRSIADVFDDQSAIHHLFSVASSLDSMVIGETQIGGQLRDAYRFAKENGYCDQKLTRAVHYAFKCAAEVRNVTDISSKPVSVASVAVDQAKQSIGSFEGKRALIIGAGEMSVITAKHLVSGGANVVIMNRTRAKAEAIAEEVGAQVLDLSALPAAINEFELLFTSTGSLKPIITEDMIGRCSFKRYWFDMAVPRDIECSACDDIDLFQVDDLKCIVNENMALREDEAKASFAIVGRYTVSFFEWLKSLSVEPLIKKIYSKAYSDAACESQRVLEKGFIPKEYEAQLHKATRQVMNRFLHDVTSQLREMRDHERSDAIIDSFEYLFEDESERLPDHFKN